MDLHSYLTFSGNCREAMTFYQDCLGGELSFQTIGESPLPPGLPAHMKNYLVHASLCRNGFVLMASDMVGEQGLVKGNAVSMMLQCSSPEEIRTCYEKLSRDGQAAQALEPTYWGGLSGDLTDKFGNHWLLHYQGRAQLPPN